MMMMIDKLTERCCFIKVERRKRKERAGRERERERDREREESRKGDGFKSFVLCFVLTFERLFVSIVLDHCDS